jgi:hypothetical protein
MFVFDTGLIVLQRVMDCHGEEPSFATTDTTSPAATIGNDTTLLIAGARFTMLYSTGRGAVMT